MRKPKRVLVLTGDEYRLMLNGLVYFRNKLIAQGRYTDAVDDLLFVLYAKTERN